MRNGFYRYWKWAKKILKYWRVTCQKRERRDSNWPLLLLLFRSPWKWIVRYHTQGAVVFLVFYFRDFVWWFAPILKQTMALGRQLGGWEPLLCSCEDPSSNAQHHVTSHVWLSVPECAWTLSTGGWRQEEQESLLASHPSRNSKLPLQWETLSQGTDRKPQRETSSALFHTPIQHWYMDHTTQYKCNLAWDTVIQNHWLGGLNNGTLLPYSPGGWQVLASWQSMTPVLFLQGLHLFRLD